MQFLEGYLSALLAYPWLIVLALSIAMFPALKSFAPKEVSTSKIDGLSQNVLEEMDDYTKDASQAPVVDIVWEIGISQKAVSVSSQGTVRIIEFTKDLNPPTLIHVWATVLKAIASPNYNGVSFEIQKPSMAVLLSNDVLPESDVPNLVSYANDFGIKIITQQNIEKDPELIKKWQVVKKEVVKVDYIPQPNRGCYVCKCEIPGKASQCSACRSIVYCGVECAV
jgi:hypothetical protein